MGKYEDTPLTNFPDAEDNWERMSDLTYTLLSLASQYNQLWEAGKISEANALLDTNPTLKNTIFNADKWNKLRDAIIAIERYYIEDVEKMIERVAQNALGINDDPEEQDKPIVAYSAKKIDESLDNLKTYIDDGTINENLLDNWYFIDPINQKGETSYTNSGFTIDRWNKLYDEGTISLSSNGLIISGNVGETDSEKILQQSVDLSRAHGLIGKELCLSAVILQGTGTLQVYINDELYSVSFDITENKELVTFNFNIPIETELTSLIINIVNSGATNLVVSYIKLEKGHFSTLTETDEDGNISLRDSIPNRTIEFLKCLSATLVNGGYEVDSLDSLGVALDLNFVRPSESTEITMYASKWSNYKYIIEDSRITSTNIIEMFPGTNQTDNQLKALTDACMLSVKQEAGALTVKANKTPTIDVQVILVFRKDI